MLKAIALRALLSTLKKAIEKKFNSLLKSNPSDAPTYRVSQSLSGKQSRSARQRCQALPTSPFTCVKEASAMADMC
jgi:hypothetical protein